MPYEETVINRQKVDEYLELIRSLKWGAKGEVHMLVETPQPHRHVARESVEVVKGKGFSGDHAEKSYYKGRYIPGREVSAIAAEVLDILGVDPVVVGDNLITRGVDLTILEPGDLLHAGDLVLERSPREHRPCTTFRRRTSPEAFAVVSRNRYRGSLFIVRSGGALHVGDALRAERIIDGERENVQTHAL